jgi:antitoxin component YwqK of YwqJK toxin-antitoxin module
MVMRGQPEPDAGAMDLRREYWDQGPNPTQLRSEVEGLVQRGGAFVKHGSERAYYRSGQMEFERHWVRGAPAGEWLSWWEDGSMRSRCSFNAQKTPQLMEFWHANGQVEARGMATNGLRIGVWEFFHDNGVLESTGEYEGAERSGMWISWDKRGELLESGSYERGVKVGEWSYRLPK